MDRMERERPHGSNRAPPLPLKRGPVAGFRKKNSENPIRKFLAALLALPLAAALIPAPASAQTPVKIMVGGIDKQIYLPAKLAAQLGFFKEQGLDVELFNSTSGSQAATAHCWRARCRA